MRMKLFHPFNMFNVDIVDFGTSEFTVVTKIFKFLHVTDFYMWMNIITIIIASVF